MRLGDLQEPPFAKSSTAASFVNKVRISIFGGRDLCFWHQDILCHDHEYCVIKL